VTTLLSRIYRAPVTIRADHEEERVRLLRAQLATTKLEGDQLELYSAWRLPTGSFSTVPSS
jgi:hypothetical protein